MSPNPVPAFDELSEIDAANVVRCARVLLRRPLLHHDGPDGDLLPMMYRQRAVLQELFATLLGYRLVVQRRFARLHKAGPGEDATRGEPTLSPRGYAYFALTLATLTGIGRQVLLSRLVDDVRGAAGEAGVDVVDDPADRRALTAALRHLVNLGVISETEGAVAPLATDTSTEALITIDTELLGQLVSGPLADSADPEELVAHAADAQPHGTEHAVRRRLVENPVVLYADLPPEQAQWLRRNQARESRLVERFFGLVTESRLEGVAATDPQDYLTDVVFPGPGTIARAALLALPELLGGEQRPDGKHPVTRDDVGNACRDLVESYPSAWSRQATEDLEELTDSVVRLLHRLGLLIPDATGDWLVSPAAHRWVPTPDATPAPGREPEPPPPQPAGWSLFDEMEEAGGR